MISFSLVISLVSLAVSSYALYRGGPVGPKGDVGDTGPRGLPGRNYETQIVPKLVEPVQKAYDEDYQTRLVEIKERLRKGSGLIASDPSAQSSQQPDWRRRNQR